MTTVINTPGNNQDSSDSSIVSVIVGLVILLVVVGLFFVYVLPVIRNSGATPTGATTPNTSIDVNLKLPTTGDTPAPTPTR